MKAIPAKQCEAIAYYGILITAALLCAFIVSSFVRWTLAPRITADMRAYILIAQVPNSGQFSNKEQLAESAYAMTDDPDIRKIADWLSRVYRLPMSSGIETQEEENSLSGVIKILLTGIKNPETGIDTVALAGEYLFGGLKTGANRADARYMPIFRNLKRAQAISSDTFWLLLMFSFFAYRHRSVQISAWLRPQIQRLHFISGTPGATEPAADSP